MVKYSGNFVVVDDTLKNVIVDFATDKKEFVYR